MDRLGFCNPRTSPFEVFYCVLSKQLISKNKFKSRSLHFALGSSLKCSAVDKKKTVEKLIFKWSASATCWCCCWLYNSQKLFWSPFVVTLRLSLHQPFTDVNDFGNTMKNKVWVCAAPLQLRHKIYFWEMCLVLINDPVLFSCNELCILRVTKLINLFTRR